VEGQGVSRSTANMRVRVACQVVVEVRLQFLGVGALKGMEIVYGSA